MRNAERAPHFTTVSGYTNRPVRPLCNSNYTSQTSVEIYGKQMVDFDVRKYEHNVK